MKTFWDCIRASAGNSFVWETGGPMVMQGTYDPSFTIDLQSKDNQLGYDMAKKYKVISYLYIAKPPNYNNFNTLFSTGISNTIHL